MISEDVKQEVWELFHTEPPHDLYYPKLQETFFIKTLHCAYNPEVTAKERTRNGLCAHCRHKVRIT